MQDLTVKRMEIAILPMGEVDPNVTNGIKENLAKIFPRTIYTIIPTTLPTPEEAYNRTRSQYSSNKILNKIRHYAKEGKNMDRILGVVDIDIYVPNLNFVFGQAECLGKAALISLYRLKPEFYAQPPNNQLFMERSTKEAIHELGHTVGLRHCPNPSCVMHFSNSIFETDRKQSLFCNQCYHKVLKIVNTLT